MRNVTLCREQHSAREQRIEQTLLQAREGENQMTLRHILDSKITVVSPHAIKACGELEVYLHSFLPLALDRASVQIHDPGEEYCLLIE